MRDLAIRQRHKNMKLSNEDVRRIKLERFKGTSRIFLAKKYGIHVEHITAITRGVKRKWV